MSVGSLRRGNGYTIAPETALERVCAAPQWLAGTRMAVGRSYRVEVHLEWHKPERFEGVFMGPREMMTSPCVGFAFDVGGRVIVVTEAAVVACHERGDSA